MGGKIMISKKIVEFRIYKPDYNLISKSERRRITRLVMRQLFSIAARFDGTPKVKVSITARGNV